MQLVSMKLTDADKQADKSTIGGPCDYKEPDYPWGLRVCLDEVSLGKLGLTALPQVGEQMHMMAMVKVSELGAREYDGKTRRDLTLIITDMALMPAAMSAPGTVLFPSMAKEG